MEDRQARQARHRRDASLDRIPRLTAKLALATAALVGALGFYVSRAFPGHQAAGSATVSTETSGAAGSTAPPTTASPTTASPATTPAAAAPATNPSATPTTTASTTTTTAPWPPTTVPVRTQAPAHVTTGGS